MSKNADSLAEKDLERGTMVFHNETLDEKLIINFEQLAKSKISVEVEFEPGLRDDNFRGTISQCALLVIEYLSKDGELDELVTTQK